MTVYVLIKETDFDEPEAGGVHGVYSSLEKAKAALEIMGKNIEYFSHFWYDIEEWEVDTAAEYYRDEHIVS